MRSSVCGPHAPLSLSLSVLLFGHSACTAPPPHRMHLTPTLNEWPHELPCATSCRIHPTPNGRSCSHALSRKKDPCGLCLTITAYTVFFLVVTCARGYAQTKHYRIFVQPRYMKKLFGHPTHALILHRRFLA
jgi:hypothetical protein